MAASPVSYAPPPPLPLLASAHACAPTPFAAGRGRLSGKPLLSEAAQQLAHDRQLDLRALTAGTEPRLRPPKPQRGLGGWLRRHLSVNTGAPWRAGKKGLGVLGLRSCFGGGKKQGAPQQGGGGGNGGAAQKQQ